MENKKENYYVFLSIDGTLWDGSFGFSQHGPFIKEIDNPVLKPKSINALNFLLENLETFYDTHLVITSRHRENMPACVQYLESQGLNYDKPYFCTPYVPGERGQKIVNFMEESGEQKFTYPSRNKLLLKLMKKCENPDFSNYVVIDNKQKKLSKQIPQERMIITNPKRESLTQNQVEKYLAENYIPFMSQLPAEKTEIDAIPQM